jgi:hypothetical protein
MVGARAASDSREGEPGWGAPLETVKSVGSSSLSGRAPDRPIVRGYVAFAPSSLRLYPACTTYPPPLLRLKHNVHLLRARQHPLI